MVFKSFEGKKEKRIFNSPAKKIKLLATDNIATRKNTEKIGTLCAKPINFLNRKHFIQLHKEEPNHFGIIVCSFDFIGQANQIHTSIQSEEPLLGKLIVSIGFLEIRD